MKKVLIVASVASMIDQFNKDNIKLLKSLGYAVDVATNFDCPGTITKERSEELVQLLDAWEVDCYQVDFDRNVFDIKSDLRAYSQLNQIFNSDKDPMNRRHHDKGQYTFVHCHSPIGGALGRLAAKKNGVKTIYTAHGFHFYDGAPIKNWMIFYPIEKWLSKYTDILITINKEDYKRAEKKFHAKKTVYVPGVGVDTEKFSPNNSSRNRIRKELGLKDTDTMLLSVGELNENKNHSSVIKAISGMNITYVIVGKGEKQEELQLLAEEYGVKILFRENCDNIADYYDAADIYILLNSREELNLNYLEAMTSGLPVLCERRIENSFFQFEKECQFDISNVENIRDVISFVLDNKNQLGYFNKMRIREIDFSVIKGLITNIPNRYVHLSGLLKWQLKRKEVGVPLDGKVIISIGELSKRKNHKVVVEALQNLPNNYWYVIVGRGALREKLKEIDSTNRLIFLGYRTDIVDLLDISDIFAFPSLQEGLPVALMEALATGISCVASKIRGNVDLLEKGNGIVKSNVSFEWENEIINKAEKKNIRVCRLPQECSNKSIIKEMRKIYSVEIIDL